MQILNRYKKSCCKRTNIYSMQISFSLTMHVFVFFTLTVTEESVVCCVRTAVVGRDTLVCGLT